jgi:hypothetical protein
MGHHHYNMANPFEVVKFYKDSFSIPSISGGNKTSIAGWI